ncbi:uncharacterized protein F4817DRAFT_315171 [Daldinia loculata]|uniref:uncharacterized protein n=1 Tax=Daldinia loculata TaxID=103429 RepID=UPI0020C42037|nr:uncharacterized protein F4817DRAFT_315171 [Daldinia loculata]KAI1648233.1 hypothetical protein F4817DRAFT_315171 [Daldinia loculata]
MASDRNDVVSYVNQAKINVTLSASPILSLSDPKSCQHGRVFLPITICTDLSAFDVLDEGCGLIDVLARGAFGGLRSVSGDATKNISLGYFHVRYFTDSTSSDLRERDKRVVTIPGDGSPVTVGSP